LAFKGTFVVFVLCDELAVVETEVLLGEYAIEIGDDPIFVVQHEVVLDSQLEILLDLIFLQIFINFSQFLTNRVCLFSFV